jgi:putative phage-type endonuclease
MSRLTSAEYAAERARWLDARTRGIGASDAAAILGVNPWKSALMLYAEKIGLTAPTPEESERMKWGHRLEQPIADAYEDETGRVTIDPGDFAIIHHRDLPYIQATLDRRVTIVRTLPDVPQPPGAGDGALEIKTTNAWNAAEWADEPPLLYQVQLQHQLAVASLQWGSLAVLIGGQEFRWQDQARNDEFIAKMIAAEDEFWFHVQHQIPPAPDASASSAKALALLYPKEERDTILLDGPNAQALIDADARRQRASDLMKQAEAEQLAAENLIKAAIGDHTFGFLTNGVRYSWKYQTRPAHSVGEARFRALRRSTPKGSKA